jgi:hypothetical protein
MGRQGAPLARPVRAKPAMIDTLLMIIIPAVLLLALAIDLAALLGWLRRSLEM